MAQNEHVLRQWMMEREAQAQQQEYALNKSRQGLASNLNPGLLAGGGAPRHQQLQSRMQSLTGPMYPDGRQTQNDIRGGTGIRPNYPTPELRQHRGEVSQSNTPPRNIGLLDDARQYARGLVPEAVRDGLMNAQTWRRGGEARTPVSSEDVTNKSATELLINGYDRENMEGSGTDPLAITAPPEMYNPPDATMTLTKPFPITSSTRQSPPNLGLGQRAGGTYGDAEMQRMVALSQQLQNQSVA
jgi:hypothetical protein